MEKSRILLIGSGGVGTMCALALENGRLASVTAVLRSNYAVVKEHGFQIDSIDHGSNITFRPSGIRQSIPDVASEAHHYDFIVVTTKNVPDIKPTVADIIAPAVTPGRTAVVMLQNGLNIERPLIARFPTNTIISGVSLIGATEYEHGKIRHDDRDRVKFGPFQNPGVDHEDSVRAAKRFVEMYAACGKVQCEYDDDVLATRWRKLIYNSTYNSIGAILQMDSCRMRIYEHIIDDLVRPAMLEIKAIARAAGVSLPDDIAESIIRVDPTDTFFKPSMAQDVEKGNFVEHENLVGEPVREAKRLGVAAPTLTVLYAILKGLQTKAMEQKGLVKPEFSSHSKYLS